jgi:hypothetical protein
MAHHPVFISHMFLVEKLFIFFCDYEVSFRVDMDVVFFLLLGYSVPCYFEIDVCP